MRLLLDSCAVVWWLNGPKMLSDPARTAIASPANQVFVSAASIWELGLKIAKGKLRMPAGILGALNTDGILALNITCEHAEAALTLPPIHGDPFDRLIVAQAMAEEMIIVSRDDMISQYPVRVIKA